MIDLAPWDEIRVFGNPWHGVMDGSGKITLGNGVVKTGKPPLAAGIDVYDYSREHILVRFPGQPVAPVSTAAEIAEGMVWKNDAILAGPRRQYSPFSDLYIGVATWLYRTADSTVWVLQASSMSTTTVRVSGWRINVQDDPKIVLADIIHPTSNQGVTEAWPSPSGAQAILPMYVGLRAIVINVSGGTKTSAPALSWVVETEMMRNVIDTAPDLVSGEAWICARYLANGNRVDFWDGGSREHVGGSPGIDTRKRWIVVGNIKTDLLTLRDDYSVPGTAWSIDFDGFIETGVGGMSPSYEIKRDPAIGVVVTNSHQDLSNTKVIFFSAGGTSKRLTTPYGQTWPNHVTDPRTGNIVQGSWIW